MKPGDVVFLEDTVFDDWGSLRPGLIGVVKKDLSIQISFSCSVSVDETDDSFVKVGEL